MTSLPKTTRVQSATRVAKKGRTKEVSPKTNQKEKNLSRQLTVLAKKAKTRQIPWLKL